LKKILQDPLVYFLLLGASLFVLFGFVASDEAAYDSKVIDVDRDTLLTFVQYRSRAFEAEAAAEMLDNMSDEELGRLVDDYVREEALHREAIALGVDKNDYVIKRRMIQSIEFITDGFITAAVEVTDEDLARYFDENRDDYYINPYATFTHVFVSNGRRTREEMRERADALLGQLNREGARFSDATRYGDRFPYFVNYVERDPQFVASHFGRSMAEGIFALEPSDSAWHGPFESEFGMHLVMLTRKADGRYPEPEEVEDAVRNDAEREAIAEKKKQAIEAIVGTYEVRVALDRPAGDEARR
jgi:hypothetical protein